MNPTEKNENSNFKNGTDENATGSSPEEGGNSAESHGPVSLAQTMYDEIVSFEFDKEGGGDPEASKPKEVNDSPGPVVSEISAIQPNEPTENQASSSNLYKELIDAKSTKAGRVLEELLSTTTSLTSDRLLVDLEASQQGNNGSVPQTLLHRLETSTTTGLETIETSSSSVTNAELPLRSETSMPEAQAELIEEGHVSYESTHYNTDGVSGEREPTQSDSTPKTTKAASKRRVWIGVGIAAVVAVAIAIVLGLTLPKSASGNNSPSPSPVPPSGFASLQSSAELQRAVDDYLAGGERKAQARSTYGDNIGSWNVSDITNFDQLFSAVRNPIASTFNETVGLWDVSNATSMKEMFLNAAQFDQPLKAWNVSSVVDMTRILSGATSFRQDLCDWRALLPVSCILTDSMQGSNCVVKSDPVLDDPTAASFCIYCSPYMAFKDRAELLAAVDAYLTNSSNTTEVAAIYGHPIGTWQVSLVTDFSELFSPLRNILGVRFNEDISAWNTSAARSFRGLFRGESNDTDYLQSYFNKPLNDWPTGSVTDMSFMFSYNAEFNQSIAQWDTAKVTNFSSAFRGTLAFDQPLNDWNTSSAIDMNGMFSFTYSFNQRLDSWDVGNVREMGSMFSGSFAFNNGAANESRPLLWDTSNVINMREMFALAWVYNQPMDHWNVSSAIDMRSMFYFATVFNQSLCSWLSQLSPQTDVSDMFAETICPNVSSPVLSTNPPTGTMCTPC